MNSFNYKFINQNGFTEDQVLLMKLNVQKCLDTMNINTSNPLKFELKNISFIDIYKVPPFFDFRVKINIIDDNGESFIGGTIDLEFVTFGKTRKINDIKIIFNQDFINKYDSDLFDEFVRDHIKEVTFKFSKKFEYVEHIVDYMFCKNYDTNLLLRFDNDNTITRSSKRGNGQKVDPVDSSQWNDIKIDCALVFLYLLFINNNELYNDLFPEYQGGFNFKVILDRNVIRERMKLFSMVTI